MAEAVRAEPDAELEVWRAQDGPQSALIACPVFEVFFGGARGGGKTDGVLGDFLDHEDTYGKDAIGLMIRRSRTELVETIERSRQIYGALGWVFNDTSKMWRSPRGGRLRFAYLERDSDAEAYQGHSYTRVYIEEIGNFPSPAPVLKLMATLRSGAGVPVGFRATGNPGGPGHQWVKARYIDPAPQGWRVIKDDRTGLERVYIPSRVSDNQYLGDDYVQRLKASGSEALTKAWLEGDWSVIAGAYFDRWSTARHVVRPVELPAHWTRFRAMDWGSAKPFSVGWYAISDGEMGMFPRGALVRYREWYGASEPNVGLKLTAEAVADGIRERTPPGEKIAYSVCDPAMKHEDGGPSIAERMYSRAGIMWRSGDNKRQPGWDQVRQRLEGEDGRPMLYVFSNCTHLIRTLPSLQHDELKPEDLDSDGEDHAADELRYACMSRPWLSREPVDTRPIDAPATLDDVIKLHQQTMRDRRERI